MEPVDRAIGVALETLEYCPVPERPPGWSSEKTEAYNEQRLWYHVSCLQIPMV